MPPLRAWESFYVIAGSSAAALTGLQFVVIVLGSERRALAGEQTTHAFATPTIVHFCAVLLISAVMSAPWDGLRTLSLVLAGCAVAGVVYVVVVIFRMKRQRHYAPVAEDWIFHAVLPLAGYVVLLVAATALANYTAPSLFVVGGTAILLLFIGIHNAWDAAIYIALSAGRDREERVGPTRNPDPSSTQGLDT